MGERLDVRMIPLDAPRTWRATIARLPCPAAHRHDYCRIVAEAVEARVVLFHGRADGHDLVCPLAIRARAPGCHDVYSPYGFGGLVSTFPASAGPWLQQAWSDSLAAEGHVAAYVMQHPVVGPPPWREGVATGRPTYILDLRRDLEHLWARLDKTHRYEIRRMTRAGNFNVRDGGLEAAFRDLYPATMDRVGAGKIYRFSSDTLAALCAMDCAMLVGVEAGGDVVAVALFLVNGTFGEYFLAASAPEGRRFARLLVWEGVRRLQARGTAWLNLGGGVHAGDGLEAFKRRFGGEARPLTVLRQILRPDTYDRMCAQFGHCPSSGDGYFPAYWKTTTGSPGS